ncbi:cellulase family glycosylhydrolase [Paenibacillus sp. SYP-B3998]|uniref:Endoglucanase n=1 Tax=Paenibacillus sp. SYP-B3998 TaxID=2678564 RepID=A0A6G4A6S7_9BACL|nr:cellulase family glycosylhydrolase [Paenibacillus sp. SYP-B3998]NEW09337.1 cellulase family glycosylhydrolase [Paenibacillus sp. SYP-B3998]
MKRKVWRFALIISLIVGALGSGFQVSADGPNYYHTNGNRIVDSGGKAATFNGVSWFGFETSNFTPHGLWTRSMDSLLDQLKDKGYNLLRIPYTNEMFLPSKMPNGIDYSKNPDLQGLTPIQILDKLIEKAGTRKMKVFLDRHRPTSAEQTELWYTSTVSETTWVEDWKMLAQRYTGNDTVIGADLHNEPHGNACWGCGDSTRDWRLAAERAGNAILSVNSNWLIIVEGVSSNVQGQTGNYWWGGNLKGVQNDPVRLTIANRIVYSPHDYGPGVASQPWFSDPTFPNNMPNIWDTYWGYIHKNNIAPILVGEFGGRSVDTTSTEGKWQNALVDYIKVNDLYWTYWCINPNSGDTGGLLQDDWVTWNQPKQDMLNRLMEALPNPVIPSVPTSLVATSGNAQTTLNWTASTSATSYNVKRATTSGGPYTAVATGVSGTSYANTGLTNGTTYYYVVSAVNIAGESPNSSQVSVTPQGTPPTSYLAVQYRAADTNINDNQIKPHFNIKNNGTTAVNLSDLSIRYYFTKDGTQAMNSWIDWAQVGGANIQRTFVSTTGTNTDTYVELSFTSGVGSIPAGGQSGDIQLRMSKTDWSNFNESNDYSFDGAKTSYTNWDKVTLFQNGTLVWGIQP